MTHPLRRAYIDLIDNEYGITLWGDKTPQRTEAMARRVSAMGIPYPMFIRLAIMLWDEWSARKGHAYPYWNVVTSDATFETLKKYMDLVKDVDFNVVDPDEFAIEVEYAFAYIHWMIGQQAERPPRPTIASDNAKILAAEYICQIYGLDYVSSNYNDIARDIMAEGLDGG